MRHLAESSAYYNEIDKAAAAVLRQLISDGVIAPGDVDERSIKEVQPDELKGYKQCHFFAGGGLWSVAARTAGWDDNRELWTGSCPCQPFSVAGRKAGEDDPRHLWPDFHRLIRARRPAVVVGEQVAGAAGYGWFDGVRADLAREDYASRCIDIPACAVDAPHQRNRLYWVAMADRDRKRELQRQGVVPDERGWLGDSNAKRMADAVRSRRNAGAQSGVRGREEGARPRHGEPQRLHGIHSGLADANGAGLAVGQVPEVGKGNLRVQGPASSAPHARNGSWWAGAEWIACHDGKARRARPGTPMLVDGFPGRVDLWRITGNAISPVLAAEVLAAIMDG